MRRLAPSAFTMPNLFHTLWPRRVSPPRASAPLSTAAALSRVGTLALRAHARAHPVSLSAREEAEILACVACVSARDLGVPARLFARAPAETVYVHVGDSPSVSMAVFVLPPGGCIPLHDHPDMYVFSKVLFGALGVESYDVLAREAKAGVVGRRRPDETEAAGGVRVLTPTRGNVHCFRAREWTAVFDVVLPPYDAGEGRDCTYWRTERLVVGGEEGDVVFKVGGEPFAGGEGFSD